MTQLPPKSLAELPRNNVGIISGFQTLDDDLETRLREIGFAEGDEVEPLHFGLFGGTPITVRLNGTLIALRRKEALCITLESPAT